MDPILYNRLTVELAYFTILVLFAVVALLMVAKKSTNIRQIVALQIKQPANAALANIARKVRLALAIFRPHPSFSRQVLQCLRTAQRQVLRWTK